MWRIRCADTHKLALVLSLTVRAFVVIHPFRGTNIPPIRLPPYWQRCLSTESPRREPGWQPWRPRRRVHRLRWWRAHRRRRAKRQRRRRAQRRQRRRPVLQALLLARVQAVPPQMRWSKSHRRRGRRRQTCSNWTRERERLPYGDDEAHVARMQSRCVNTRSGINVSSHASREKIHVTSQYRQYFSSASVLGTQGRM